MDMRGPCNNCPFRNDIRPYVTLPRMLSIIDDIAVRGANFVCHKTTVDSERDDGECDRAITESSQHCGGAMVFLEKISRPNQMMRMAMRLGILDPEEIKKDSPVFASLSEVKRVFREAGR